MKKLPFIAMFALAAACGKDAPTEPEVAAPTYELSLSKGSISMHYDQRDSLSVVHVVPETESLHFTFASSDTNVVQVDGKGVVSGVSVGNAVITAASADGTAKAECGVTIVPYSNMYVEPPFKWDMTRAEALALVADNLLRDMGNGGDIYARWTAPVDSIRYGFVTISYEEFLGINLYINLSTDSLFNEANLFIKERCGTNYKIEPSGGYRHVYQNRHDNKCEIHVYRGVSTGISISYIVKR